MDGTIVSVLSDRGFGFIRCPGISDIFFHARDLAGGLVFSEQLRELRVSFDTEDTEKGPRATNVRPAN